MIINTVSLTEIKPSRKGRVITNGTVYSDSVVYLAATEDPNTYWEITSAEYAAILKKKAEEEAQAEYNDGE